MTEIAGQSGKIGLRAEVEKLRAEVARLKSENSQLLTDLMRARLTVEQMLATIGDLYRSVRGEQIASLPKDIVRGGK